MDINVLRALRSAEPFKPFSMTMRDGRHLPVERPSIVAISPGGGTVVYAALKGGFEFISTDAIAEAAVDERMRIIGGFAR
jgi:hypothetical protein